MNTRFTSEVRSVFRSLPTAYGQQHHLLHLLTVWLPCSYRSTGRRRLVPCQRQQGGVTSEPQPLASKMIQKKKKKKEQRSYTIKLSCSHLCLGTKNRLQHSNTGLFLAQERGVSLLLFLFGLITVSYCHSRGKNMLREPYGEHFCQAQICMFFWGSLSYNENLNKIFWTGNFCLLHQKSLSTI